MPRWVFETWHLCEDGGPERRLKVCRIDGEAVIGWQWGVDAEEALAEATANGWQVDATEAGDGTGAARIWRLKRETW